MISWHKVGQSVVCVNAAPIIGIISLDLGALGEGKVYEISEVVLDHRTLGVGEAHVGFRFDEVGPGVWISTRFRPVYPDAVRDLKALLVSPKVRAGRLEDA